MTIRKKTIKIKQRKQDESIKSRNYRLFRIIIHQNRMLHLRFCRENYDIIKNRAF